jgi:hypothetical protein
VCGSGSVPSDWRQQTPYDKDEDFTFASPKLKGKQPPWGQTMTADFVKPAVIALRPEMTAVYTHREFS